MFLSQGYFSSLPLTSPVAGGHTPPRGTMRRSDIYTAISHLTRPFTPLISTVASQPPWTRRHFPRRKLSCGQVKGPAQDQAANVIVPEATVVRAVLLRHHTRGCWGSVRGGTGKRMCHCLPQGSREKTPAISSSILPQDI